MAQQKWHFLSISAEYSLDQRTLKERIDMEHTIKTKIWNVKNKNKIEFSSFKESHELWGEQVHHIELMNKIQKLNFILFL